MESVEAGRQWTSTEIYQMKTYQVTLPITGIICTEVEADSPKDAIERAMEMDLKTEDITEWDAVKVIVEGNCFRGHTNKASAEEAE